MMACKWVSGPYFKDLSARREAPGAGAFRPCKNPLVTFLSPSEFAGMYLNNVGAGREIDNRVGLKLARHLRWALCSRTGCKIGHANAQR